MIKIIGIVFIFILCAVLVFFLFPKFVNLCKAFADPFFVLFYDFKDGVKETKKEWKTMFKELGINFKELRK